MADIERIPHPKLPRSKQPKAVSKEEEEEERKVIEACRTKRDRLIVETLFATGVRVSELCALLVDDLHMERQPYLHVRGSIHDRDRTKNGKDRKVPFRSRYSNVPRRLVEYKAGGGKDLAMVRRYYSADVTETLDAFARAHEF